MRGRPPKPLELQRKQGNPRKRAASQLEPIVIDTAAADGVHPGTGMGPSPWLANGARTIWRELVGLPVLSAVLRATDLALFERYVVRLHEWRVLSAALIDGRGTGGLRLTMREKRRGYTITKPRIELAMRSAAESDLRAMESLMGLSPSARGAVFARLSAIADPTRPGKPLPWGAAHAAPSMQSADQPINLPPAPASPLGILKNRREAH